MLKFKVKTLHIIIFYANHIGNMFEYMYGNMYYYIHNNFR